jgi:hypothetical protein
MPAQRLFIAASRASAGTIKALLVDLEELGYSVYLDTALPGGDSWWSATMEALESSDALIYVLTASALDSDQCRLELEYAEALQKPVLPVLLDDGLSDFDLPAALGKIQRVDYRAADRVALAELSERSTASRRATRPCLPVPHGRTHLAPIETICASSSAWTATSARPLSGPSPTNWSSAPRMATR